MATPTTLPATAVAGDVLTAAYVNALRGAFRILQVVSANTTTEISSSSTTYVDTGLTATITPQSATSKIIVVAIHGGCAKNTGNALTQLRLQLLRTSTQIGFSQACFTATDSFNFVGGITIATLDSPATTSATTYKTQISNNVAAASVIVQHASSQSTMFLLEVSA
jgi:hypothetical protein